MGEIVRSAFHAFSKSKPKTSARCYLLLLLLDRTIFCARKVILILIGMPGDDLNEIGHKRGYQAFDNRRIAPYHVLLVHIGLVVLSNNCNCGECVLSECLLCV